MGILGAADGYYVRELMAAAARRVGSDNVQVVDYNDVECGIDQRGRLVSPQLDLDALIVRSMPLGSLEQVIFRIDCLHSLQRAGRRVVNPPRCLEIAIDKWLTLHRLGQRGLSVPPTYVTQNRKSAMEAWETLGGDVVVKPLFGGEGRGIIRVTDRDMAWRVFGTLQQLRAVIYLQQFIPNLGYDLRILCIGDQQFAIRRHGAAGQWRTNVSQGASVDRAEAGPEELCVARQCQQLVGGEVVGVDLLPGKDGRTWVLEVNAVPGWRGVAAAWGIDVAALIVEHTIAGKRFSTDEQ